MKSIDEIILLTNTIICRFLFPFYDFCIFSISHSMLVSALKYDIKEVIYLNDLAKCNKCTLYFLQYIDNS